MKIYSSQLDAQLKKSFGNFYLICGEEPLLVQEAIDKINSQAKQINTHYHRESCHANSGFDWQALLASNNNLSLFAENKIIEVNIDGAKIDDKAKKILDSLLADTSSQNIIILKSNKNPFHISSTQWFKNIEKQACVVLIYPLNFSEMLQWAKQQLAAKQLKIATDALQMLCQKTEGNLLACKQAIEKLSLLHPDDTLIKAEDIDAAIADSSRFDIFQLVDCAFLADAKAIHILNNLKQENLASSLIVWALSREINQLIAMKKLIESGETIANVMQKYRVLSKRKTVIQQALKNLTLPQLQALLVNCAHVDKMIKGLLPGDIWLALTDLCLQCGNYKIELMERLNLC